MREVGSGSPFQAKNSQAQKEQWIWWQCQRDAVTPVDAPPVNALPEREMPPMQPTQPVLPAQPTRHQQYDAILRRMRVAQGKTGAFTACGTSTQPSSGS